MKAFYIAGTHWDREWYEPFQEFRMWLVQMMDHAVELLENDPQFRVFHLDGQAVMLEDYLEIRPEQGEALRRLMGDGRLIAGPWYVMPDEFLVSGEALIRNLQIGMQTVRSFGAEPLKVGYIPDMFGHIASIPTVFSGFELKGAVLWRGANDDLAGAQFIWQGPDGSQILLHKLPDFGGYGCFFACVRVPWERGGCDEQALRTLFDEFLQSEGKRLNAPLLYLSDAHDHEMAAERASEMLRLLGEAFPKIEFHHCSMERYFEELEQHRGQLPSYQGELRHPSKRLDSGGHWLIPHCLSSRYPLKQRNDRCQNLLELWAEPLAGMALAAGSPVPGRYLDEAWKWLLKNQPHDSVCGCSVDETHDDMLFRYHQCELLGQCVVNQAMARLSAPTAALSEGYRNVVLYNPLPRERSEVVTLDLLFPPDYEPKRIPTGMRGPTVNQFELVDVDGEALPYQILDVARGRTAKVPDERGHRMVAGQASDIYRVAFPMNLPAAGFTTVRIRPLTERIYRDSGSLRIGPLEAENEHLRLRLSEDGLAKLEHKDSGLTYSDLFMYEDTGDRGDGWIFVPPIHNSTVVSGGHSVQCAVEHEGSQLVTFRIDRVLRVPESLDTYEGERRSERTVDLPVTDFLTLKACDRCLHVLTRVNNTARDHRLRVLFPTDISADTYYADQPFCWLERPVAVHPDSLAYKEPDPVERPHHGVFGIEGARGGLAVLCPEGLHEHSICDDRRRTLALTLLRGFRRTVKTDGEPGPQVLGDHEFAYALFPYAGALPRGEVLHMLAGIRAGVLRHLCAAEARRKSLWKVEGGEDILVTVVKPSQDGSDVIIRLWNTGPRSASARIVCGIRPKAAALCNLNEEHLADLSIEGGQIGVEIGPKALATVRISFEAK